MRPWTISATASKMVGGGVFSLKRTALLLCFIGITGLLLLGAFQEPPMLDLDTVAMISH